MTYKSWRQMLVLSGLLSMTSLAQAQYSQTAIDVLGGHKGLISEFFFLKPIDKKQRWLAISRSELHLPHYESAQPEFVNFNTFSYNFRNGLGIGVGTYASSNYRFSLRTGAQYFKETETTLLYAFLSTALTRDPDAQLLLIGSYTPELNERWKLFTRAELRSAVNYQEGHAFSNQLLRVGLQYNNVIFGAGAELEETIHEFSANVGPFVRILLIN